jgi:copper chaperone
MGGTPSTYTVSGMTCEHCERAVIEGVSARAGVESTGVNLDNGRLVVVGDASSEDVAAAVREAGFDVTA